MRIILSAIIALGGGIGLRAPAWAASAGSSGAAFLKIGVGARAVGMGESFSGVADDVSAVYWNPAGLANINKTETTLMHDAWLQSMKMEFMAYGHRISAKNVLAVSLTQLDVGKIEMRDRSGVNRGQFTAQDRMGTVSFARSASERLMIGASLKIIQQTIADETASATAYDAGTCYREQRWRLGFAVQNLGSAIKFREEAAPLPMNIRFGGAVTPTDNFTASLDLVKWNDRGMHAHAGIESLSKPSRDYGLALRAGLRTETIDALGMTSAFTFGCGLHFRSLHVDYAWVPYGDLGSTHRVSLSLKYPFLKPWESRRGVRERILKKSLNRSPQQRSGLDEPY